MPAIAPATVGMTWLPHPKEKRKKTTHNPPKFRIFEA